MNRRLSTDRKLDVIKRKVLVIRVKGADSETSSSEQVVSDQVFGASDVNLKTQYEACSYDQMIFEKADDSSHLAGDLIGDDGVYTVTIPNDVNGANGNTIRRAAVAKVLTDFKVPDLEVLADHIMVCIPPGTNNNWIAYGYVNSYLTVFNDQ